MVHPILQIFIPDTLQASLIQYERQRGHHHRRAFNLIGFTQRQSHNSASRPPDDGKGQQGQGHSSSEVIHLLLPDLVQVSLVALSSSYKAYESSAYHDDEVVGQVILDDEPLQPTPSWACSELPSLFVTLRIFSSTSSIRVERVVLDGLVLSPDPGAVLLFHYAPSLLNQAHHLRHLHESESGLPPLLRAAFRPLPRHRDDLIPLQGREWPSSEVASDPFGLQFGDETSNPSITSVGWLDRVISRSMGIKQINLRVQLVLKLFHGKLSVLAGLNLVALLTLDITLGVMLTTFLLTFFPALYATLHAQVHILLRLLLGLLEWLKGSPAGLKLNSELNSLLWRFFSYHLHLWANYIGILEPILSLILSTIIWIGPLSFTVQLSLMKDLISMATFHVYCLYIYATRLYHIFLIVITSLGRLFFGRKWNPLRNRVDHVHLSISEVFLGALFFTIAIFLSPTVIIYYTVFLSLRLTVLFLELSLSHFVATFNSIRPVSSLLILANSPRVCDQVYLERVPEPDSSSFQHPPQFRIRLQATKSPFSLSPSSSDEGTGFSLLKTISYIIRGQVLNR